VAGYNKFYDFTYQQLIGTHNWSTNTFKIMLVNFPAPIPSNSIKADLTEISGGGYPAGGLAVVITLNSATGVSTVLGQQLLFLPTFPGGTIGPFQYAVLYNDSASNKNLVAWWDYGTSVSVTSPQPFNVVFNGTSPGNIFTLT